MVTRTGSDGSTSFFVGENVPDMQGVGRWVRNDLDIILHKFKEGDIEILPIADVHYGSIEHNEEGWTKLCKDVLEKPNVYLCLVGDLINNGTKNSLSNVYLETVRPRTQKAYMTDCLMPLRDRILCLVSGNHCFRNKDVDDNPCYDIACKLDIEDLYRENAAFMAIQIGEDRGNRVRETYKFMLTHGTGGGMYSGATINRNERTAMQICEGIDCFIAGHTHKGMVSRPSKLVFDINRGTVYQKDTLVVSCVSWMSYGGYAMRKMLLPAAHSQPQRLLLKDSLSHRKRIEVIW